VSYYTIGLEGKCRLATLVYNNIITYHLPNEQVASVSLVFATIKQPHSLHRFALVSWGQSRQIFIRATPNSLGP